MRREGRQHGIVRTYRILPPPPLNPRLVNSATPSTSSAVFTKLPSKPTRANRRIWYGQVHWLRSNDMASSSSYKLLTCRIITRPGTRSILDLAGLSELNGNGDDFKEDKGGEAEDEMTKRENGHNSDKEEGGSRGRDVDESMSFYDVGMMMMEHVLDHDDDEEEEEDGWCLV
ncbi:unnamed protein product [Brassica oleracea var. botrytis]|uniref:Uncharacterized protein n=1 Tax=Brassica oleracea var. oleracea TaxID=109376 RepID=A0A0D3DB93_BRAOL|nr:PREDICTED: uncharacterized protein LOC106301863 [Brassica oleracea var. oleracea]